MAVTTTQQRCSRRFRVFTVVDDFSRRCVALVVDTSLSGGRLARVLSEFGGLPTTLVCDNGPEFTSQALDQWAFAHNVHLHFIRPTKPTDNAFIESFNGKLRNECLNTQRFADLDHARRLIAAWRDDYNDIRPAQLARRSNAFRVRASLQPPTHATPGVESGGTSLGRTSSGSS